MAICAVLLGGMTGFLASIIALVFFGAPVLSALSIYMAVGLGTTLTFMIYAAAAQHLAGSEPELSQTLQQSVDRV